MNVFKVCKKTVHLCKCLKIATINSGLKYASSKCDLQPLDGVRVLDLTRIVAGPYCTMILGDLGAEVIKIERPGTGDESRNWGPPYVNNTKESCYFVSVNRNKKSICIDIKHEKGRDLLYEMARRSDVLVENYVPGKLDSMGLGYDELAEIAPHLIYCSITGFGSVGPYKNKPGYDAVAASMGGLLHITGPRGGDPVKPGVAVTDLATGLYAHGAIIAALLKRVKTGKGQKIDCDLLSTQLSTLINIGSNYLNGGKEAIRWGTAHGSIVPYQAFKTSDGYFTVGAGSDVQYKQFCSLIDHPHLATDAKFLTNKDRVENREELITTLRGVFEAKTNKEWSEIFAEANFPCGPVNSIREIFNDEHVKEVGLVQHVEHPVLGEIKMVGPAVTYSDGGNSIRLPPPTLGQHTDEIMKDVFSCDDEYIKKLRDLKVLH